MSGDAPLNWHGPERDPRRDHGRVAVTGLRTSRGVILDASAGGLRIRGSLPRGSRPGTVIEFNVLDQDGKGKLPISGEVRWIQRHPFRGATFGVAFVNIDDDAVRQLFSFIRSGGVETRCTWRLAG
ncbi:MAG: PilZ domain-containing protein [Planctomycetota bacterium]